MPTKKKRVICQCCRKKILQEDAIVYPFGQYHYPQKNCWICRDECKKPEWRDCLKRANIKIRKYYCLGRWRFTAVVSK